MELKLKIQIIILTVKGIRRWLGKSRIWDRPVVWGCPDSGHRPSLWGGSPNVYTYTQCLGLGQGLHGVGGQGLPGVGGQGLSGVGGQCFPELVVRGCPGLVVRCCLGLDVV